MKTTAMGVILDLTGEQKAFLDDLMARYCAARAPAAGGSWAFNRLLRGVPVQQTRVRVQGKFDFNSRQANDAVHDAQATISSQKELVNLHYENAAKKVEFTHKRLEKAKSPAKRARLQRRMEKDHVSWRNGKSTLKPGQFRRWFSAPKSFSLGVARAM